MGRWNSGCKGLNLYLFFTYYEGVGVVGIVYSGATSSSCVVELLDCPTKLINRESQKYLKMSTLNYGQIIPYSHVSSCVEKC